MAELNKQKQKVASSEWSIASSNSTLSKQSQDLDQPMPYKNHQLKSDNNDTSMELARQQQAHDVATRRSHHPPQHADASIYRTNGATSNNYSPVHLQHLQDQQRPPTALVHPHTRAQLSPNFHSRSSPIAIMHNPEDSVNQAKLRWQHPMYDTSDDEDDEDTFMQGGISVESLTSPMEGPHSGVPKSLPTAILRAPKLGSLPSQDYRLLHLATLPPPMCLNGDSDVDMDTDTTTTHAAQKPRYLSSYGSLRESHLTGRFGGGSHYSVPRVQVAASTGQLPNTDNRTGPMIRPMEPPATLLPPRNPAPNIVPRKKQPPAAPLSIRDRMMQKVQQQKEGVPAEQKKAASSLSAMLANDDNNQQQQPIGSNHGLNGVETTPQRYEQSATPQRRTSNVLPASMANAVAISYNSNLNLFAAVRRQSQHEEERSVDQDTSSAMLSSSMTGLEILRAASKASSSVRPTSLSTLQSTPRTMQGAAPPATMNAPPTFMQLSRTASEPHPHVPQNSPMRHNVNHAIPSNVLAEEASSHYNINGRDIVVRTPDGRTLIPPQSLRPSNLSAYNSSTNEPPHTSSNSQPTAISQMSGTNGTAWTATGMSTAPINSVYGATSAQVEGSNPDTQGAFDMDLE